MITIESTIPCLAPPTWAVLERGLIALMVEAIPPFLRKYTHEDGTLIWRDTWPNTRDGVDDFYEAFYNWPLLYLLGGPDDLLPLAARQWEAVTRQLTTLGPVHKEYERGYDQFHQSEHYTYFYYLCLADPQNPLLHERARRFAGLFLNDDPEAPNYDPKHRLIRAPHNGSGGPRWGYFDGDPVYGWSASMEPYGLPLTDIPGINSYADLKDPVLARRMGEAIQTRMGRGDVATNLLVTSLVANAYLMTGDERYRQWVVDYVDAWSERAQSNGGLLPDNVGLSGEVGEYLSGKWYGGLYGWTWPHGFYNVGMAALVAGANAHLLTRDRRYLDLPRTQIDAIWKLGTFRDVATLHGSLDHHWIGQFEAMGDARTLFVVPYRYSDDGWFDEQPMSPVYPVALWNVSMEAEDWERVERIRAIEPYDWSTVVPFRNKEDGGHEQPWLRFLAGDNPGYPEAILRASYGHVARRVEQMRQDHADLRSVNIHHWQNLNPVLCEALVQLTLGAPAPIYNGGLLHAPVRYFDGQRQRPGLPPDVAALVERVEDDLIVLTLVNLSVLDARTVVVQAGTFAEHRFTTASYPERTSDYPGRIGAYAAPALETVPRQQAADDTHLSVILPPGTELRLELGMERYVKTPTYQGPWG